MRISTSVAVVLLLGLGACSKNESPKPAAESAPAAAPIPVAQMPKIDGAKILEHIKALSADDMQGRAPGGPGEEKAVAYIESQFKAIGLQPGNPDGTYIQKVPMVGITGADQQPLSFEKGAQHVA